MPHLDIPPSKWDTSVGALKVRIADARRFLGHNLAAVGEKSGVSERVSNRLGLDIRAGLHTGEIERRGSDIGGIAVHLGQRVSAIAGAREVVVSSTVKDLVAGSGIEFEDRGEHELKGVPGEWHLFAVAG